MDFNNSNQTMLNLRGRVVGVASWEVEARRVQGWKIINNPKRDYYPEFDLSAGGQKAPENLAENLNENDILKGEWV